MGASTFVDWAPAVGESDTARSAFQRLTEDAREEHGCGGYTGTIAEKHKFRTIDSVATKADGLELADQLLEDDDARVMDKWGPAGCIEVATPKGWIFFGNASD